MFLRWSIRRKLLLGIALLLITVTALSVSSFFGVSAFRSLAKSIRLRAPELPLSSKLAQDVSKLTVTYRLYQESLDETEAWPYEATLSRETMFEFEFDMHLATVARSFQKYSELLAYNRASDEYRKLRVYDEEELAVQEFAGLLAEIRLRREDSFDQFSSIEPIGMSFKQQLERLEILSNELPEYLHSSMQNFANEVRGQYRSWMITNGIMALVTLVLLITLGRLFYVWVFRPLETLVVGSRRVANGDFEHQIKLDTEDEIAELATAMNGMTRSFRDIRDDLNKKVQQKTKEVVRSEQLASVGFLAAGVAHEINNPLASIALCAESLEQRLADNEFTAAAEDDDECEKHQETSVMKEYLNVIQTEAFRCKEITERLLDFSRLGDVEKQATDLSQVVQSVIRMIKHLGKYKSKEIQFDKVEPVVAAVNAQEIKQVILNLMTNALDSLDPGGKVVVALKRDGQMATLSVRDNGCGMTEEVQKNLFEPFFTRRRGGQGTGLGMSITYRIVNDHGGDIAPHSEGPGKGSTFIVSLPLISHDQKQSQIHYAA